MYILYKLLSVTIFKDVSLLLFSFEQLNSNFSKFSFKSLKFSSIKFMLLYSIDFIFSSFNVVLLHPEKNQHN